ncbi:MAG: MFS transporter [Actinomycetota bacterium]
MATTAEPEGARPAPWREVLRGPRGRLTGGLLLLEAMVGIEVLIVTTILPAVERDLGGLQLYGWAFSAYGLATLLTVPLGGRATDRFGPRPVLGIALGAFAVGLLIASVAPSMEVIVLGRFVQGCGGGALYVVSVAAIAKAYPESLRPRVFALLTSMWILPGVIGPPIGALIASTIGWRWAFVLPVPVVLACLALILPPMRDIRPDPEQRADLPFRWPLQLTVGTAILLAGLTVPSVWTAVAVALGSLIAVPALLHVVPRGTLRAAPGLPATAAAAFLTSAAFAAIDGFVPLMLTRVRGLSVGQAGLVVTGATITWCLGTFWQSRRFEDMGARRLVAIGGLLVAIAAVLVSGGLVEGFPIALPYIGWAIGGLGMGIAFPTIPLSAMTVTKRGHEAGDLSSTLLMDFLGISLGAGLAGACVALADAGITSLRGGIAGAFAIGFVTAIGLALVARRLPVGAPAPEL